MIATVLNKASSCSSQQVSETPNSLPSLTPAVCSVLMTAFGWRSASWSCHQAAVPFLFSSVCRMYFIRQLCSLWAVTKGSSCYDENSSAAWVSCFCLTPGSVTLLKTQTALSPHGDILMAANHTSISSYMSPSNRLGDGKGLRGEGGGHEGRELACFCACVWEGKTGPAWVDFSFLSPSPLAVTTERFIFLFIHLGYIEPQRAGKHK